MALLLLLAASAPAGQEDAAPTLAVLNFVNLHPGDPWDWLSKGLADMLITDLGASPHLRLVERERMQAFFAEMDLAAKGIVDPATAARFGKMVDADLVLLGTYGVEAGQVQIEGHVVRLRDGQLMRVEFVKGPADQVLALEKELARRILQRLDVPLAEAEKRQLARFATLRVPAAAAYYGAFDAYDAGDYASALGWFRLAVRQDPAYLEARFRVGEMYTSMGEPRHALIEFRRVADAGADLPHPAVAAYLAAKIEEEHLGLPEAQHYLAVARKFPGTFPAALSACRAGDLYRAAGRTDEAYEAYLTFDALTEQVLGNERLRTETGHLRDPLLHTRSDELRFSRYRALEYIAAFVAYRWNVQGDTPARLPPCVLCFTSEKTRFEDLDFSVAAFSDARYRRDLAPKTKAFSRSVWYLLAAPKGMVFKSLKVTVHMQPFEGDPQGIFTPELRKRMRGCKVLMLQPWPGLYPSDRARAVGEVFNTKGEDWFQAEARWTANEPSTRTFSRDIPQHCRAVTVSIQEQPGLEITSWDVEAELSPARSPEEAATPEALRQALAARPERPQVHEPSLLETPGGELLMAFGNKSMPAGGLTPSQHENSDICLATLDENAGRFGPVRYYPCNSIFDDYHPHVTRGPDGTYWMVFVSRRSLPTGSDLFLSSSSDGRTWTFPRKVQLDFSDIAPTLSEHDRPYVVGPLRAYNHPRLLLHQDGRLWLAFNLPFVTYVTNSSDGVTWRKPVPLGAHFDSRTPPSLCEGQGGHVIIATCASRYGPTFVSYKKGRDRFSTGSETGVFFADVAPDLSFPTVTVAHQTRPADSFLAPEHQDVSLLRKRDGEFLLVYRRRVIRDVYVNDNDIRHYRDPDPHVYVCASRDLRTWRTWQLASRWPADFPRADNYLAQLPMAAGLQGDRLVLMIAGANCDLAPNIRRLADELTPQALRKPVTDLDGRQLPATAWVLDPERDLAIQGLTDSPGK